MPHRLLSRHLFATLIAFAACAGHAQALRPLPPEFLATLQETDGAVASIAGSMRRFKTEDLGIKTPSASQLDEAIGRMDKSIAQTRSQLGELQRRESLLVLLSIKGTLGAFGSDLAGFTALMQAATVRNPVALEKLNREIAVFEQNAQAAGAALRKFDSGAYALLERLDRQAGAAKPQ